MQRAKTAAALTNPLVWLAVVLVIMLAAAALSVLVVYGMGLWLRREFEGGASPRRPHRSEAAPECGQCGIALPGDSCPVCLADRPKSVFTPVQNVIKQGVFMQSHDEQNVPAAAPFGLQLPQPARVSGQQALEVILAERQGDRQAACAQDAADGAVASPAKPKRATKPRKASVKATNPKKTQAKAAKPRARAQKPKK